MRDAALPLTSARDVNPTLAPTPFSTGPMTSTSSPAQMRRRAIGPAATARRSGRGDLRTTLATELAAMPWRGGQLRLLREPWGHHTILHERAGDVSLVGEADAAMLAERLFVRMILMDSPPDDLTTDAREL